MKVKTPAITNQYGEIYTGMPNGRAMTTPGPAWRRCGRRPGVMPVTVPMLRAPLARGGDGRPPPPTPRSKRPLLGAPGAGAACALDRAAPPFRLQPPLVGGPARSRRDPRALRRRDRLPQQGGKPGPGGAPVGQLAAVLGGGHGEHAPGQAPDGPGPSPFRQRRGARDVEGQLDPAVGGVDRLAAGPGRPGEALAQLAAGD